MGISSRELWLRSTRLPSLSLQGVRVHRQMASILITGGAGYVGSHCVKALAARGHEPVVFDNLTSGYRDFIRWGRLIEGDIRDATALDALFSTHQIDAVMHFAALAYVGGVGLGAWMLL
jgi:nucleoside-diphosphate-sugar epimerase